MQTLCSSLPSFPRSKSYLDIHIYCRLNIITENNIINCLKTVDYDSDHSAIQICCSMNNDRQEFFFYRRYTDI